MGDEVDQGLALLRHLRHAYPARVSEADLLKTVSSSEKVGTEVLKPILATLTAQGLVMQTEDEAGVARVVISTAGISMLEGLEPKSEESIISPWEMESKLIATYDSIKNDMEGLKRNLERSQREFEKEVGELRKSIADHDQFLRTYFVRIIESISVFIGIFGIVVVMMVNNLKDPFMLASLNDMAIFIVGLPLLLILTVLPTLYLIKRTILNPRRPPV